MDPIAEALLAATSERDRLRHQLDAANASERLATDAARLRHAELTALRTERLATIEATRVRLQPLEFRRRSPIGFRLHGASSRASTQSWIPR